MTGSRTGHRARIRSAVGPAALLFFLLAETVLIALVLVDTGSLSAALALAASAVAGSVLVLGSLLAGRCAPAMPPTRIRTAIRDREQRTAFLPQRDPDGPGRTRPRAPGRPLLTA